MSSPSLATGSMAQRQQINQRSPFSAGSDEKAASDDPLSRIHTARSNASSHRKRRWWKIRLFRGMIDDVKRRAPYYWSDWRDAWDYRVVPATVYMYFANILPALAFSLDMFSKTDQSYGVNEVLLASVLASVVFSLFAAQPLTIVGVTGPITVFNYTVYDIVHPQGIDYFQFMCWIGIWSLIMHWILAITNACNGLTYVTRFSCDIFGFYVAFIYLQKGIQVLTRQWGMAGATSAYLSIMIALLVMMTGYLCGIIGESPLFQRYVRKFIEDYGTPLTVVFFTGFVHIGHMRSVELEKLPTSKAFFPTQDRSWAVPFWNLEVGNIFLAIPFAILLTILFYFDHNVSSLIAQGSEFPLRKPAGFHWDIFLLGITTGVSGILGIPFPNGLIPQAPFHTASLCVHHPSPTAPNSSSSSTPTSTSDSAPTEKHPSPPSPPPSTPPLPPTRTVSHVVEQRLSNLSQGLLTLLTMTGPLLTVLHLIPQSVLAGLFFIMGLQALASNGITLKLLFLFRDHSLPPSPSAAALSTIYCKGRRKMVWGFVGLELVGFGATFAITQTIAAIGFPIIILGLIPVRTWLLPRVMGAEELRVLDEPTASGFVYESVGGAFGVEDEVEEVGEGEGVEEGVERERAGALSGGRGKELSVEEGAERAGTSGSTKGDGIVT